MKKIAILVLGVLGLFLCHALIRAQGSGDQPSGQSAKTDASVVPETPKESAGVVRAEAQYVKALLASARDPALFEERQLGYWVRLARLGYMPAFERISELAKAPGAGELGWLISIDAIRGDKATVVKLLGSEKQEVRWSGILLAGFLGMQKDLREFAGKELNPDPATKRVLWLGRALARDFGIVPALAAASEDKAADGRSARVALAAYFGEDYDMSLGVFRMRLEAVIADTRPAAPPAPAHVK
jgi:hypothetical protein